MPRAAACLALLLVLAMPGCSDLLQRGRDLDVARTPIERDGWNREPVFTVHVREREAVTVDIKLRGTDATGAARALEQSGPSNATLPPVALTVPDGTWTLQYWLDGTLWESFKGLRYDSTPPTLQGLETIGQATNGAYSIGSGVSVDPGVVVRVVDQADGRTIATSLPATLNNLPDGIHPYDVVARDPAGNEHVEQVQVIAGDAARLPEGNFTLGLVARYTLDAQVWDISDLAAWPMPAQARQAAPGWQGSGRAVEPDAEAVQEVVAQATTPAMTTGEAAFALFRWMMDNLEYDDERLAADGILRPHQTLRDEEDPTARAGPDGLVADGDGNGVRGGVCRELAATYVSLLRAAGIPARLVTGYLGGDVDGFHAWAEFYGGPGHGPSPWVPVDVSAVDGPYDAHVALQAFGIRHTNMLPLRALTPEQEQGHWSTALAVNTRYIEPARPEVTLGKSLQDEFVVRGTLCVHVEELRRAIRSQGGAQACGGGFTHGIDGFVRRAQSVLDYGAQVEQAAEGTSVTVTLAYPDDSGAAAEIEAVTYCSPAGGCTSFQRDPSVGKATAAWNR